VISSPAGIEFGAVHLFSRGSRIPGGDDGIVFIDNDRTKVAPQAGALVGTPNCQIQKIMMPVGSHSRECREKPLLKEMVWDDLDTQPGDPLTTRAFTGKLLRPRK